MRLVPPRRVAIIEASDNTVLDERIRHSKAVRRWTVALVVLCVGTLFLLFRHIDRTLPYPQHTDEVFIAGPASDILVKGDLHPQRFNYPSLPTYIAATAMALGFVRGAAHLEIRDVSQIGGVAYPHYDVPRIMQTARQAFALLSVICVAATGLSAWLALRRPAAILLAPVILLVSPLYFRHSWVYLNVDIVAASFAMMAATAVLVGIDRPSISRSGIVPGTFAGLATASKYTLAVSMLPVLLASALYVPRRRIVPAWIAAIGSMILAFLVAVPYSLIDIPGFLNGVGYEVFHYASGHAGFADDPGWPQVVFYTRHFLTEFGYGAVILAAVGLVLLPFADWRRAAVVTIFPAALFWLLIWQRVHFTRSALAIQPFVAIFAAYGVIAAHRGIVAVAARRGWTFRRVNMSMVAGVIVVVAAVPFWRFADHLRDRTDSRNVAREWIAKHVPLDWAIVVPSELGFQLQGLEKRGRVLKVVELGSARDPGSLDALLHDVPAPAVILVPRWGADRRSPGQSRADALNALSLRWRVMKTFGSNHVLVNYSPATAWGDPAFAIAVLK